MTGLVSAGAPSSEGSSGNVSDRRLSTDATRPETPSPLHQTAPEASGSTRTSSENLREQHKEAMLADYGIKVRDYAYESTLPPVRSYRPPRPKGPQPLRRKRKIYEVASSDEEDDSNPIVVLPSVLDDYRSRAREDDVWPSKRPRPLERTPTEPIEESQSQPPMGYSDVSQITEADAALNIPMRWMGRKRQASLPLASPRLPICPVNAIGTPTSYPGTSSEETSQDSEPWIDTPPISPFTSPVELPTSATLASTSHIHISQHAQTNSITHTLPHIYPATTVAHSYPSTAPALEVTLAHEHTTPHVNGLHHFPLPLSAPAALPATRQEITQIPRSAHPTPAEELAHVPDVLPATPCERQTTFFDVERRY
ncbi:hypothetical protein EIP86_003973 [Pleurotus ostreatoroseus]|nr:hypothetical protein EIP86_003973 [Pleurotus ostreatoroseus]